MCVCCCFVCVSVFGFSVYVLLCFVVEEVRYKTSVFVNREFYKVESEGQVVRWIATGSVGGLPRVFFVLDRVLRILSTDVALTSEFRVEERELFCSQKTEECCRDDLVEENTEKTKWARIEQSRGGTVSEQKKKPRKQKYRGRQTLDTRELMILGLNGESGKETALLSSQNKNSTTSHH